MNDEGNSFRRPAMLDPESGTYVTANQIKFFLNKRNALASIKNKSEDFSDYITFCRFYNYFWDVTDISPDEGFMFWDDESETIAFQFPANGKVSKYLSLHGK